MVKSDEEIELEIKLGNARARCRDLERQRDELIAAVTAFREAWQDQSNELDGCMDELFAKAEKAE